MAGGSSGSLIDLKTLGKPLPFDGSTEKWASWAFKFEAWCGFLPDVGTSSVLDFMDRAVAASDDNSVTISAMGQKQRSNEARSNGATVGPEPRADNGCQFRVLCESK